MSKYGFLIKIIFIVLICFNSICANCSEFNICRLKYSGGDWYTDPTSLPNLLKALKERVGMNCSDREKTIDLLSPDLFNNPFLYATGHGNIKFSKQEVANLREYLERGGFLYVDDCYGFDKNFRRELKKVFPEYDLIELPFNHGIYHCYYDLSNGVPKVHLHDGKPSQGFGIFHNGRLVVFYTYESDIGDGLEDPEVHNDPPHIRESALQMAINIVIYNLFGGGGD